MARVKYSSLVSSVSGSVGSATFQKSLYGDTLRNKPRPRKSSTALQLGGRGLMMKLHQAWHDLTDAQRKQWNQFISYSSATIRRDKAVLLTGHGLFLQYNMLRLLTDLQIMTTPVYVPLQGIFDSVQLGRDDPGVLTLVLEDEFPGTQTFGVIKLSAPRRPSLSFSVSGLRGIHVASDNETNFNITALYTSLFGAIPEIGDTVHYSFRRFSTLSPIVQRPLTGKLIVGDNN
jgi:hypothetical protein